MREVLEILINLLLMFWAFLFGLALLCAVLALFLGVWWLMYRKEQ